MKAKFKENTFVKGNYNELMEMAKAIEEKGAEIRYNRDENSNHLWWSDYFNRWYFGNDLIYYFDHEITKSQLFEAYGVVDTKTETEKLLEKDEHGFYKSILFENMETRPIQISKETATRWYNGEDNELKQLAIQTYPELDEATPKAGDLCLFEDNEVLFGKNIGLTGTLKCHFSNGTFERQEGGRWKFCKKIKSIEFYD